MECIFVLALVIGAVIYFYQTQIGKMAWCENCNKWSQMTMQTAPIKGYICPNCKWINQEKYGACPTCGWYGKYQNGTLSRRGPFKKVDRTPVTPFWGVQEEYWAYEVRIQCPKHGIFTAYIPVDAYQTVQRPQQKDYDDSYCEEDRYDDENRYYDDTEQKYYDDEYHPRGLY